jgi:hypothetical protein
VNCQRAQSRAGKDCGEIICPVRQPQRHPTTRPYSGSAQRSRHSQHAILKIAPAQSASGICHCRRRRVAV